MMRPDESLECRTYSAGQFSDRLGAWEAFTERVAPLSVSRSPRWLVVLQRGMDHQPYAIEAARGERTVGLLLLQFVQSRLFGRFLVSLPYLSVGGALAESPEVACELVDHAIALADRLDVKYLELRHEQALSHARLSAGGANKVHMRLALPRDADTLWKELNAKVRNQIRKGQQADLTVEWGSSSKELDAFYVVFSRNMRDLGTPVFGRGLFEQILGQFVTEAELCIVRAGQTPVAAALLMHGRGTTEVPSASALRAYNSTNCNMLMYWHLLQRTVFREQQVFDFGRSTAEGSVYRFKKQWGAQPQPAVWQYYLRRGDPGEMRIDHPKHRLRIWAWQRLPVWLTRWIGPKIVRGIP